MNSAIPSGVDRLLELVAETDPDPAEVRRLAHTIPDANLTEEQIERVAALVAKPPKVELPALNCPAWCDGECEWSYDAGEEFSAWHMHTLGRVTLPNRDISVAIQALESFVDGAAEPLPTPMILMLGDPDSELDATQAVALMKLLSAAVERLEDITGERASCCSVEPCSQCRIASWPATDLDPAAQPGDPECTEVHHGTGCDKDDCTGSEIVIDDGPTITVGAGVEDPMVDWLRSQVPDAKVIAPTDSPLAGPEVSPAESAPPPTMRQLVDRWIEAQTRAVEARLGIRPLDPADVWAELATGAEIAREASCGRWAAVAQLLQHGAVQSWTQVGQALELTETEAHDGFNNWISGQRNLHQRTGSIGLTDAEAEQLAKLAKAVTF